MSLMSFMSLVPLRFLAYLIDLMLRALSLGTLALFFDEVPLIPQAGALLCIFLLSGLYYALFESSPWQATPGKYLTGLKVMSRKGERLSFAGAFLRWLIKFYGVVRRASAHARSTAPSTKSESA